MRHLIRPLIITGTIASMAAIAIMMVVLMTKDASYKQTQIQVDKILKIMSCPNNECDRYKGEDARRDFADVYKRINEVEKACILQNTSKDK